jgi:hypothetical protein
MKLIIIVILAIASVAMTFLVMVLFFSKKDTLESNRAIDVSYISITEPYIYTENKEDKKEFDCYCTLDRKLEAKFGKKWHYGCDKDEFESYQMNTDQMCPGTIVF